MPTDVAVQKPSLHVGSMFGEVTTHGPQNLPGSGVVSHVGSMPPDVLVSEPPPVGTPVSETLSVASLAPPVVVVDDDVPSPLVSEVDPLQARQRKENTQAIRMIVGSVRSRISRECTDRWACSDRRRSPR